MNTLQDNLKQFIPAEFVDSCGQNIQSAVTGTGKKGIVFGASGGIDSLTTAALCMRSSRHGKGWPVIGLQMTDSRVVGENYHPEAYRRLGVELVARDITEEAVKKEKQLHMPPRWLTVLLMKVTLRRLPAFAGRWFILEAKSEKPPAWSKAHLDLLTLLHRIRIARLREFATAHGMAVIICANRTEALLGYFVEQGVDDTRLGDLAPISDLYKTQVITLAKYLGLPEEIIEQKPSPGFGGIYDEEILGPYEVVDQVLAGFERGCSDEEIAGAIEPSHSGVRMANPQRYVRFLRALSGFAAQKNDR